MAMPTDQPVPVVVILEFPQSLVEVLDTGKGLDPEELLLEGAPESLNAAVPFRGTDEGRAGFHAEEPQFGLEGA